MKLIVREEVEDDAFEAALWYEQRRAGLGQRFRDRLAAVYESIEYNPDSLVPSLIETSRAMCGWPF